MRTTTKSKQQPPPHRILYAAMGLLIAFFLIGGGAVMWLGSRNSSNPMQIGGPFALENSDGKPVTDKDFRGKFMLVYFGYTFCPDVCPTTLTAVGNAMDKLGPTASKIVPIFISVDPKRDTPEVMKKYVAAFGPSIVGLTGKPDEIAKAAKEYRVYYAEHKTGPGPLDYSVDHSSVLYLMDPKGNFVAPLRADESGDALADKIMRLIG